MWTGALLQVTFTTATAALCITSVELWQDGAECADQTTCSSDPAILFILLKMTAGMPGTNLWEEGTAKCLVGRKTHRELLTFFFIYI